MGKVFDLEFTGVRLLSRDFGGNKFGPDQRQFRIEITDPQLVDRLSKWGVKLWQPQPSDPDEPVRTYMNVKVSYRFGAPDIAMITPDKKAIILTENNVDELDSAWLRDDLTELHVHGSTYERMGRTGVTVYLDTLVTHLLSKEEIDDIRAEGQARSNPVRDKYRDIFGI